MNILQLELRTHNIEQQRAFYADALGLPVVVATDTRLELQAGATRLVFTQAPPGWRGYYHFAFNIPENQFDAAAAWLRARVALIPDAAGGDTFYSAGWDAHNVYFYDPAGNIGELIARHTLPSAASQPFDAHALLNISEIGVATSDVAATVALLRAQCGLAVYRDASAEFAPLGDEHGLLIVVKTGRIWYPDTGLPAVDAPFTAHIADDQGQVYTVRGAHGA